jgi:hypothetical protein
MVDLHILSNYLWKKLTQPVMKDYPMQVEKRKLHHSYYLHIF